MAFDVLPGLGQPLRRLEDPRLLTGGGRFTANRREQPWLEARRGSRRTLESAPRANHSLTLA